MARSRKTTEKVENLIEEAAEVSADTQENNDTVDVVEEVVPGENVQENDDEIIESGDDRVAIFSERPVHWIGVGVLGRGVNLLPADQAQVWIDAGRGRKLTANEVVEFYQA